MFLKVRLDLNIPRQRGPASSKYLGSPSHNLAGYDNSNQILHGDQTAMCLKTCTFLFFINSVKDQPILIIFGIRHRGKKSVIPESYKLVHSPTNCCRSILEVQEVILQHESTVISIKRVFFKLNIPQQ